MPDHLSTSVAVVSGMGVTSLQVTPMLEITSTKRKTEGNTMVKKELKKLQKIAERLNCRIILSDKIYIMGFEPDKNEPQQSLQTLTCFEFGEQDDYSRIEYYLKSKAEALRQVWEPSFSQLEKTANSFGWTIDYTEGPCLRGKSSGAMIKAFSFSAHGVRKMMEYLSDTYHAYLEYLGVEVIIPVATDKINGGEMDKN